MTTKQKLENKDLVGAKRWAAYAAAGAASVVGAQVAEADITHVVVNTSITFGGPGGTQYFSLGGAGSLLLNVFGSPESGDAAAAVVNGSITGFFASSPATALTPAYASNLASGQIVSAGNFGIGTHTATLAYGGGTGSSQFVNTGGFLGFRFDGGAGMQYGWARLEVLFGSPINGYTLVDYAYGDVGDVIATGQVPLPGSIWLLASGAAGLVGWRKARTMAAKAA